MKFLDSDIIIDFLKGKKEAIIAFKKYGNETASTEINRLEILYGIYAKEHINNRELTIANDFFNSITIFPFNEGCAEIAAKILTSLKKEGKTIHQNDALIASIILNNGLSTIITKNTRHFSIIKGIKAVQY